MSCMMNAKSLGTSGAQTPISGGDSWNTVQKVTATLASGTLLPLRTHSKANAVSITETTITSWTTKYIPTSPKDSIIARALSATGFELSPKAVADAMGKHT